MASLILAAEVLSLLIILVILYATVFETPNPTMRDKTFRWFVTSFLVMLAADMLSWMFDRRTDMIIWLQIFNTVSILGSFPTTLLFGRYVYLHITDEKTSSNLPMKILNIYTTIAILITSVGILTGNIYSIEQGIYIDGPMYPYYLLSMFVMFIMITFYVIYHRKRLQQHDLVAYASYAMTPFISVIVNMIIPGLSVTCPATTVSIVLIYVMLQSEHHSEAKHRENMLEERSVTDELTGLRNRHSYSLACSTAPKDKLIGIAFIDANGLKYINDTAGHEAGDKLLLLIADLMLQVFPKKCVFRISGDEFVIMNECPAETIWTEQTEKLKQLFMAQEFEVAAIGSSWGMGSEFSQLTAQAEDNMYIAKTIFHRQNPKFVPTANMFSADNASKSGNSEMPMLLSEEYEVDIPDISRRNLLLAVYSGSDRSLLKSLLLPYYNVVEAVNTDEAIEVLQSQQNTISLVIMDVRLPNLDGMRFLQFRREHSDLARIPVIMTTSEYRRETEVAYLRMGVADYLRKPFSAETFLDRIHQTIKLVESAAALSAVEYDELTNIYTRQAFDHHAQQLLNRDTETDYSLYLFDIQDFRLINRRYGESKADDVLCQLGKCLKDSCDYRTITGRYSGDQFLYLTPQTNETEANINTLIDHIVDTNPISNLVIKAGVYTPINRKLTMAEASDRAIAAVRSIKHKYGRQVAAFDAEIQKYLNRQIQLESDMECGLTEQQFRVYYQPKHDCKTGKLIGAEALLRWQHPGYGFLSPREFIPLFEKNGFITKADLFVWNRTCENIRRWQLMGLKVSPISVNASRIDFLQENHLELLDQSLDKYGLSRDLMHIEVTESTFTEQLEEFTEILQKYREHGYLIELDDFGSGYSALNALSRLPVDIVKMDIVFTRCMDDERGVRVLTSCIEMIKSLGLTVLCEGVETQDQMDLIRKTDNDIIQGYFFSAPISEVEFEAYLRKYGQ